MVVVSCPLCDYKTEDLDVKIVLELLKLHEQVHDKSQTKEQASGWWPGALKQSQTPALPTQQLEPSRTHVRVQDQTYWWWPVAQTKPHTPDLAPDQLEPPRTDSDAGVQEELHTPPHFNIPENTNDFTNWPTTVHGDTSKTVDKQQRTFLLVSMVVAGVGWALVVAGEGLETWKFTLGDHATLYDYRKESDAYIIFPVITFMATLGATAGITLIGVSLALRGRNPWMPTAGGAACLVGGMLINIIASILCVLMWVSPLSLAYLMVIVGGFLFIAGGALVMAKGRAARPGRMTY